MKVIVTTPSFGKFNQSIIEEMESKGCKVSKLIPYSREQMLEEIVDAEALIVGLESIDEELINKSAKLKIIAKHGVGVDNIDLIAAKNKGIAVTNAPGTNNDAVADLAFGLILSIARLIPEANERLKNNQWLRFDGYSVWGKTLGVIGLGAIGKGVAHRGKGFSMKILGYDVTEPTAEESSLGIERVTLEELIKRSDYISIHAPLNKYTKGMIGKNELASMKSTAFLINTARGGIIDEAALYEALKNKQIMGCALDVFEQEPPTNNPLLQLDNLVVTPHMGAYTVEAGQLTSEVTAQNVFNVLQNEPLKNVVNK